jgi:hypothetical protein
MNIPLEVANREFQEKRAKRKKELEEMNKKKDSVDPRANTKESKARTAKLNKEGRKGFKQNAMGKYGDQLKTLLKNKERLVASEVGDGLNKYQFQINQLKKRMKADGFKFNTLLNDVKKQEREGKFDRGEEGKTKNKLRQKMQSEKVGSSRGG